MDCDTPTTGSILDPVMCHGPQTDITTIKNHNVVVIYDTDNITLKTNGFGYLSKNGLYNYSLYHIPDPYNSDMTRNPDYFNTEISLYNAMSDFNGRDTTTKILNVRGSKDYTTWTPTYNNATDYPAASCCDMYFTEGTSQGQWYLPAAGEWGYVMSKWNVIKNSISIINNLYNNIAKQLLRKSPKVRIDILGVYNYDDYRGMTAKALSDKIHKITYQHLDRIDVLGLEER
jgi:hypothetical protein